MIEYFNKEKVQSLYPEAVMIPAMKIWSLPSNKKDKLGECCESGLYFAEIKKDGFFYQANITQNYRYLFSRSVSVNGLLSEKMSNVPHISSALGELPPNTILIGEIYVPGGTSKDVTRIMGCLPEAAIKRQKEEGEIHYYIHDIILYNGINLMNTPALTRYKILEKIFKKHNLNNYEFLELAEVIFDDIENVINKALADGEEGVVLKKKTSFYTPDKRPAWETIKVKQVDHADVVCMGFCDATKEYAGKEIETWPYWIVEEKRDISSDIYYPYEKCEIGKPHYIRSPLFRTIAVTKPFYYGWKTAIRIGAYDNGQLREIGTISSGLTDELKSAFKSEPEKYLGKVAEVQCMMKDNKEKTIRHGFFKGWREDKNAVDCTLEEVFK